MAVRRTKNEQVQKIIIFSHYLMKNGPIFFKFSQELYYIVLKQNPVTVCPKFALVHIQKSERWLLVRLFWASSENHKSKQWPSSENSPIFFKFSQENLYYMMLKQISVTVCHNLWHHIIQFLWKFKENWTIFWTWPLLCIMVFWLAQNSRTSSHRFDFWIWTRADLGQTVTGFCLSII